MAAKKLSRGSCVYASAEAGKDMNPLAGNLSQSLCHIVATKSCELRTANFELRDLQYWCVLMSMDSPLTIWVKSTDT